MFLENGKPAKSFGIQVSFLRWSWGVYIKQGYIDEVKQLNGIINQTEPKFKVGDKAHKPKGYKFPCTIVGVFETIGGEIRVIGEMDEYGLLHIFNENQLESYE